MPSTQLEKQSPDTWNRYYFQTLLGTSLMGQQRFVEAEPLLVSGREGMVQRAAVPADNLTLIFAGRAANRTTLGKLGKTGEGR